MRLVANETRGFLNESTTETRARPCLRCIVVTPMPQVAFSQSQTCCWPKLPLLPHNPLLPF